MSLSGLCDKFEKLEKLERVAMIGVGERIK